MRIKLLASFFLLSAFANAQGAWNQKANCGGGVRSSATGFSIGNKGYVGTGFDVAGIDKRDFWEWDQATDTWTQKADLGGVARYGAVGFSIGTLGYIVTGAYNWNNYLTDFWEYNSATNVWVQKANFPGAGRLYAVAFSIGTMGYIGTGGSGGSKKDFWEWNQSTDTWSQKTDFAGASRYGAVGFSIGTKGYIGTGDAGSKMKDFWEWDPSTDIWVQKADFGGVVRSYAIGFSIGTKGYIGGGNYYDFWEWDQGTNTWTQNGDLIAGVSRSPGFSIGAKGYVGATDFWEWNPNCSLSITGNSYTLTCGNSISLAAAYSPSSSNIVYSWTPAAGLNNTTIANPTASPNVTTTYTLVAEDMVTHCIGTAQYFVYVYPATCTVSGAGIICQGASATLATTFSPTSGNIIYNWAPSVTLNNSTIANPIASPTTTTNYTLTAQDALTQCARTVTFTVGVSKPILNFEEPYEICKGQSIILYNPWGGYSYSWSTGQTTNAITVSPSITTVYTVDAVDTYSCHAYDTITVDVNCFGTSFCNNEDFENGNFTGWSGLLGSNVSTGSPPTVLSLSPGFSSVGNDSKANNYFTQHTIISTNMLDSLAIDTTTNLPDVFMTTLAPGGGNYSVRLGYLNAGANAEGLTFPYTPTAQNSTFTFQFAALFQDAGHLPHKNPGFMINVYNSSNVVIPALSDTIHAPDPNYQFRRAPYKTGFLFYNRWATESLNLSSYIGQTLTIEFVNFDCGEYAHWGYTYLDVSCNTFTSIDPFSEEQFSLSPNPSSGLFTIQSPEKISGIEILNVLGEKVFTPYLKGARNNPGELTIDLRDQPKGIYFYKAVLENNSTATGKIIIQ